MWVFGQSQAVTVMISFCPVGSLSVFVFVVLFCSLRLSIFANSDSLILIRKSKPELWQSWTWKTEQSVLENIWEGDFIFWRNKTAHNQEEKSEVIWQHLKIVWIHISAQSIQDMQRDHAFYRRKSNLSAGCQQDIQRL